MQKCKQATKPALFYFLAGFLLSVLTWQQTAASIDNSPKEALSKENLTAILAHHFICSDLHLHLPFESAPTPKDREVPDENELEEDVDFDWHSLLEETAFDAFARVADVSNLYTQAQCCLHARTQVPLFILYHSWKSFMS